MSEKNYPKAVVLKKGILIAIIVGVVLIVMLVISNFIRANSTQRIQKQSDTVKTVEKKPSEADANWYKNQTIQPAAAVASPTKAGATHTATTPSATNTTVPAQTVATDQQVLQQSQKEQEALFKAMSASINTDQLVSDPKNGNKGSGDVTTGTASTPTLSDNNDPNKQAEKVAFLKDAAKNNESDYLSSTLKSPISPYELQAGTIIPGVLVTGINSDLPGQITGQVKSNVYDSVSGNSLLVPQGAKLIGAYASQISYGQERVLVVWNRIIFPNGQSIDLQGMSGVDMSGYAGFTDQVNNHYGKIFGSVLLMSMLSAGAQLAQPQSSDSSNNDYPSVNQTMAQSLGTNISAVGTAMTMKNLNIQPTLEIRQGYEFNIEVKKDMVFDGPYQAG